MNPFSTFLPWGLLLAALAVGFMLARRRTGRLQQQLRLTEASLRRISQAAESTSDAIGIGDMQGHSLYHNRAHRELFGYTVDELNAVAGSGVLFADKAVAHDFGNLLTIMNCSLYLTKDTPGLPERATARLTDIEQGVQRASNLTEQLKTFAKGGTSRIKLTHLPPLFIRKHAVAATVHSATERTERWSPLSTAATGVGVETDAHLLHDFGFIEGNIDRVGLGPLYQEGWRDSDGVCRAIARVSWGQPHTEYLLFTDSQGDMPS